MDIIVVQIFNVALGSDLSKIFILKGDDTFRPTLGLKLITDYGVWRIAGIELERIPIKIQEIEKQEYWSVLVEPLSTNSIISKDQAPFNARIEIN